MKDDMSTRAHLAVNGLIFATGEHVSVDDAVGAPARKLVTFDLSDLKLTAMLVMDPPEIEAVHGGQNVSYGFAHLRALLDALPRCQAWDFADIDELRGGHARHCRAATRFYQSIYADLPKQYLCDQHHDARFPGPTKFAELPNAAVVRHIEKHVLAWERDKRFPAGEP
jgi:hypothetical protein